ncbi:MAG: sensor histidine kinase [Cyanobacteria bacterium J083]|nr:MAG: sensor histidine kinase [Cyanobacteria bacterium J083]
MMRQAGKNMAQLLDEVLLVGRADSGTLQLNLSSLNLETFCENLLGELEFTANKKKIEVILNAEGEFSDCLWDENLLRHILGNIIANSIKYSQAGQSVLLELIGQPEAVVFRLQDWGMGIPPEDLEYLFEPFRRASNVGNIPGTGLGLAIAKSCTQTHGGKIEVVSKLGVGTTVTVTIPKISASTKQKAG